MVNLLIKVLINPSNANNLLIQAPELYLAEITPIEFVVNVENTSKVV